MQTELYVPILATYIEREWGQPSQAGPRWPAPPIATLALADTGCLTAFRLDRACIQELCLMLGPQLQRTRPSKRSTPVLQKILRGLHYLATGNLQGHVGRTGRVSLFSARRDLGHFLEAVVHHCRRLIPFPTTERALSANREAFYAIAGFPGVLGALDGTHVSLLATRGRTCVYCGGCHRNAVNVIAACNAQGFFTYVYGSTPGALHSPQAFERSNLCVLLESQLVGQGWLLGKFRACWVGGGEEP